MVVWGSIVRLLLTFVSAATDDGDGTMKMGSSTTKASDGTYCVVGCSSNYY